MSPALRKAALIAHVTCSVGVLGAVAVFLALAVAGLTSADESMTRAVYPAMEMAAALVIVPAVFAAVLTGIIQALGTAWGLFRHYWVLLKLLIMIIVATILLMQLEQISDIASAARNAALSATDLLPARRSLTIHAGLGLFVLLMPVALSIYKPRGMTRYGWRKPHPLAGERGQRRQPREP